MITAVDSSVLLDVLTDDRYRAASLRALHAARERGALIVCPAAWAELRTFFPEPALMQRALAGAQIQFDPFDQECADLAGDRWREYRRRGGSRHRITTDFLIGAHALVRAGRLLTRDRSFYRRYFASLELAGTPVTYRVRR